MFRYVLYLYKSTSMYHYISRRLDISCEIRCWQVDMPFTPQTVCKRHGTQVWIPFFLPGHSKCRGTCCMDSMGRRGAHSRRSLVLSHRIHVYLPTFTLKINHSYWFIFHTWILWICWTGVIFLKKIGILTQGPWCVQKWEVVKLGGYLGVFEIHPKDWRT